MSPSPVLSTEQRIASLERLRSRRVDVLVVGGGVVGAGAALDAASRGLSVALVEARDLASGTSSRSSKLVHGGLRYLEMLDFGLVAEALRERGLLLERLAPHLVRPVPFLYPLKHRGWERWYAGAGVALYDAMATLAGRRGGIPWHRHLTRRAALRQAPALRPDSMTGALLYYDAQVDDARHTMFLARTAAAHGAAVVPRCRVISLLRETAAVTGAKVRDEESGEEIEVTAGCVINATGVWTAQVDALDGGGSDLEIRASKGVHLVVARESIRSDVGMIMRTATSVLFVIPWNEHWLVGTTDTPWSHGLEHPASSTADIEYLLQQVNRVLAVPLERADVVGTYVGLRPLLSGASSTTAQLSREHTVVHARPGLVSVAGGKYTTYRIMARDAVDAAVTDLPDPSRLPGSCTDRLPLLGAEGYPAVLNRCQQIASTYRVPESHVRRLADRYGSLVEEVLTPVLAEPTLAEPLHGAPGYLAAEIRYAVTHEGARHVDDVMTRRTRISFEYADRGRRSVETIAAHMAAVLGWDEEELSRQVDAYLTRLDAEIDSQRQPDDASAHAARYRSRRDPVS